MDIDDKKVDIESEKVDIDDKKVDIENIIMGKEFNFSTKTMVYIHELFNEFNIDSEFGRSDVMKITGLKPSGASKLISNCLFEFYLKCQNFKT